MKKLQLTDDMKQILGSIEKLDGLMYSGLVNYQKGVFAANEDSSPEDPTNYFPQQCTAIIKTLGTSLANLNGGKPSKLMIEAEKMTMIILPINDTYLCGVGIKSGLETTCATKKLGVLFDISKKAFK